MIVKSTITVIFPMFKLVLPVLGFCMIAAYGVQEYVRISQKAQLEQGSETVSGVEPSQVAIVQPERDEPLPVIGRKARLKMDDRGHFVTDARMNGRNVEVLVDTGATTVAINNKTARKLGIILNASDFKHAVNTANGQTLAAAATIDSIRIGNVTVNNVQAAVLDDDALQVTLLGMSFLKELRSFEVKNRELLLVQ